MAAEASFEEGVTEREDSGETIRATLARLGVRWKRAKHWIESSDPEYARKKRARDRLIRLARSHPDWVLGFEDETWFSRFERPRACTPGRRRATWRASCRTRRERTIPIRRLSCYGQYLPEIQESWLRFVDGRPVSTITTQFLGWSCHRLEARGKKALLLIWDNASWHKSREARGWIASHNREVKASGLEVRIVVCLSPTRSSRLNAIEPQWIHDKRKVTEPERLLGAYELADRSCGVYGCPHCEPQSIPQKIA